MDRTGSKVSLLPEILPHQHFVLIDDHTHWSRTQEVLSLILTLSVIMGVKTEKKDVMLIYFFWLRCLLSSVSHWLINMSHDKEEQQEVKEQG